MNITTEDVKKLRDATGISIMQCKKALEEAGGDFDKAVSILQKKSGATAAKKSERTLGAGTVAAYIHNGGNVASILEVASETDFVSKNADFQKFAYDIAMHVAAMNPENLEELLSQPYIKDSAKTIEDLVKEAVQKFGENIQIVRFSRFKVGS